MLDWNESGPVGRELALELRRRYAAGETQVALAASAGVSVSVLMRYLGGVKRVGGLGVAGSPKLTPAQQREVRLRYHKGERTQDLAAEFGVSAPTLYSIIQDLARPRGRPPRISAKQWADIHRRIANGEKQTDLATEFGVSPGYISQRRHAERANETADAATPAAEQRAVSPTLDESAEAAARDGVKTPY